MQAGETKRERVAHITPGKLNLVEQDYGSYVKK